MPSFCFFHQINKCFVILFLMKNFLPTITTINHMINKSIYQSPWNPGHISESSLQFSLSPFTPHIQNWQIYLTPRSPCSVDIHSMISQAPPNNAQSRYNIAYTSLLNAFSTAYNVSHFLQKQNLT